MKFIKGQWIKYSNKIFPRYARALWEVKITRTRFRGFYDRSDAEIFERILKLEKEIRKLKKGPKK